MKLIKGFGLLSFLVIVTGSCFDPPEFPVVPEIEFEGLEFKAAALPFSDSLILFLNFKDGDGDLGLGKEYEHNIDPYHDTFFYQAVNGRLEPLIVQPGQIEEVSYDLVRIPNPENGKLVSFRTRKDPAYNSLPVSFQCSTYEVLAGKVDIKDPEDGRRLLIEKSALASLDKSVQRVDSFPKENPQYYQIKDTLYFTPNPEHWTIEVDFLVKDPSAPGGFVEFDWWKEYCSTFDGRFTILNDNPKTSVDGTLRYAMVSLLFEELFSIKTLKLRVFIRDRQLHKSNIIETPEFQLH